MYFRNYGTTAPLPDLLITVNIIQLEKVHFSAMQNLKTVNTLTPHDKYSLHNRDNLKQPIKTLLSQKQNTFSQFFSASLKSPLNFENFQKNDGRKSRCISEVTDSEIG